MELWVAGFNAWGQLTTQLREGNQNPTCSLPDDIYTFQNCIQQADKINILWSGISSTLIEVSEKILTFGSPDEITEILSQNPKLSSSIALAGNNKVTVIENQSLKFFDSIQDFKINKGIDDDICQEIIHVVANQTSFTALSSTGDVWTWGDARYYACLGREIQDERQLIALPLNQFPAPVPCLVEDLRHLPTGPIKKISSGGYVSAALTEGNDLYIWGGKLGKPDILSGLTSEPTPVDIEGSDIVDIAIGFDHMIALTLEGKLYTVGFGEYGQLGIRFRQLNQWREINLSQKRCQRIIRVYAGYKSSFVVTE